jgi:hypothetical protein
MSANHFEYCWNLLVNEMTPTDAKIKERIREKVGKHYGSASSVEGGCVEPTLALQKSLVFFRSCLKFALLQCTLLTMPK